MFRKWLPVCLKTGVHHIQGKAQVHSTLMEKVLYYVFTPRRQSRETWAFYLFKVTKKL